MEIPTLKSLRTVMLALVSLLIMGASGNELFAQGSTGDALLHDHTERFQYVGLGFGWVFWEHDASFGVSDNAVPCTWFEKGDGSGPVIETKAFLYPLRNNWFLFSPRIRYESRGGAFISSLPSEPVRGENNQTVMLEQEAQVDAHFSSVNAEIMVGVEFAESGIYAVAGGAVGANQGGTFDYSERLLSPVGFVFSGSGTDEQQLLGGREFENFNKITLDLRGGLGYIYRINYDWALNFESLFSYPVSSTFDAPDKMKLQGVITTLGVLYNIGE